MPKSSDTQVPVITVEHSVDFDASAADIFNMYADARKHAKVIGAQARLERRVGGKFSAWGGGVSGINVALRTPTLIVQAWRTETFPVDHFSILQLSIAPVGRGRSRLTLRQHGVPRDCAEEIAGNWHACYWEPIKALLAQQAARKSKGKRDK
jgi:activator of HSP90 ATPase